MRGIIILGIIILGIIALGVVVIIISTCLEVEEFYRSEPGPVSIASSHLGPML
jgi:hypothetical protein